MSRPLLPRLPTYDGQSFVSPVQVPTLPEFEGMLLVIMEGRLIMNGHIVLSVSQDERATTERPSLQRIETDLLPRCEDSGGYRGHRHSRSLEILAEPTVFDTLNSASSDSVLFPRADSINVTHLRPPNPLSGPYISLSGRKSLSATFLNSSTPQFSSDIPSSPTPSSPVDDLPGSMAVAEEDSESEDVWDLRPYDISWGNSYYGYKSGTLPGPDGTCLFLRSPIPLKYQRTGQACEKCRERKAKVRFLYVFNSSLPTKSNLVHWSASILLAVS